MSKRHEIREAAFILSFEKLFRSDSLEEIIDTAKSVDVFPVNNDVEKLVNGVFEKAAEIDDIISKYSEKRSVERIPKLNLAILRIAIYEALYDDKVPVNVAISEAVLLAKAYAFDTDVSFINGILGAFSRGIENKDA
ncbi:MAG: transcription antitermination factor NusB [Oscillospiraceae bacterium]|nr:transcription antitermination factor NusB [Oscillospiraceae bacterium]